MMAPRLFLLGFAAALVIGVGCSGGGSSDAVSSASLVCTDGGAAAANVVDIACGGATSGSTELVHVVLGGPSAGSTTVRGFNFDVTYDVSKLEFVPAASYASPLMPAALVAVALSNGQQGRVVVSIQQPGGLPDVAVGTGQQTIVSLSFRRVSGASFGPTPLNFENAEAIAASPAIVFSDALALAYP